MMLDPANAALLREWCLAGSLLPQHPLARRLVSLHGDIHAGNVVRVHSTLHQELSPA